MREPASTADRILVSGRPVQAGTDALYRAVTEAPGEAHGTRAELVSGGRVAAGRSLLRLAHLTDLHIADTQSPLRLDFAARTASERPGWGGAVTYSFRPNELLTSHAVAAMVETLSRLDLDLAVVTGDNVDNMQQNEIDVYLSAMDGGLVRPATAGGV
jgi:predicted MPP superfamily phosphohydrolase